MVANDSMMSLTAVSDIHGEPGVPQPASRGRRQLKIVLDEQDAHPTSIAGRRFSQRKPGTNRADFY